MKLSVASFVGEGVGGRGRAKGNGEGGGGGNAYSLINIVRVVARVGSLHIG